MWEPEPPQPVLPEAAPPVPHVGASMSEYREPQAPKRSTAKETARHFADPFAESDDGANCLCCGYLVEPAREKGGLLTCAACG